MDTVLGLALHADLELAGMLQLGADEVFDRALVAVAHMAKHRTKTVMDALMIWRKVKSDPVASEIVARAVGDEEVSTTKMKDA